MSKRRTVLLLSKRRPVLLLSKRRTVLLFSNRRPVLIKCHQVNQKAAGEKSPKNSTSNQMPHHPTVMPRLAPWAQIHLDKAQPSPGGCKERSTCSSAGAVLVAVGADVGAANRGWNCVRKGLSIVYVLYVWVQEGVKVGRQGVFVQVVLKVHKYSLKWPRCCASFHHLVLWCSVHCTVQGLLLL